jgi:hypothetical protein
LDSAAPAADDPALDACAASAEAALLALAGATLLFWAAWGAFLWRGGVLRGWGGA